MSTKWPFDVIWEYPVTPAGLPGPVYNHIQYNDNPPIAPIEIDTTIMVPMRRTNKMIGAGQEPVLQITPLTLSLATGPAHMMNQPQPSSMQNMMQGMMQ
eukprot:3242901-Karenia_brevis.AAC.1